MQRILAVGHALVAYLIFFATCLRLIAFLADVAIFPTTVNDAVNGAPLAQALVIDLARPTRNIGGGSVCCSRGSAAVPDGFA